MKIKYVIFDNDHAVLVPATLNHSDVGVKYKRPTSAGFCSFRLDPSAEGGIEVTTWGKSISLNLGMAQDDHIAIRHLLVTSF